MRGDDEPEDPDRAALDAARAGEREPIERVLGAYRERLRRAVAFRLHPALRARADASDVVQESLCEAVDRLPEFLAAPRTSFYLWVRFLTVQKLQQFHRRHLDVAARDARRDVALFDVVEGASSIHIAEALAADSTSPSGIMAREEATAQLRNTLDALSPLDREVLMLRHFEELSNNEIATILQIEPAAASRRYMRALDRLSAALEKLGG